MLRRYQGTALGGNQRGNQDANRDVDPTICQLAQEANPTMNLVARLLKQQNRLLANMNSGGNALRRERNADGHGNVISGGTVITLERFKKLGPPAFKGTSDPLVAEAWLKQIEKVFNAIRCPDEQKVIFATFMCQDEADYLWDATSRILRTTLQENDPITWGMFMNTFNEKYFPDLVRFRMERNFLNLKQGGKTVAEYEEQFTSLSWFATQLIPNDESKGGRFLDRLHPDIQSRVKVLKLGRYADIVDRALIAERSMDECSQFRKCGNDGHGGSEKAFGDGSFMENAFPCQYCGRSHAGECYRKTGACFGCGKAGHMLKDCPKRRFGPDNVAIDEDQKKKSKL
ncbi:hypothetical protein JRO89_XS06G0175000 [Xanthoceras sorbifolium]|uniref:CCHC-type domain-containing protein n=1 Tax=Xanthoceras sorbifolium TaxID=99658 RepID=A0ABQ8HYS1_9ROSI|nr:hypothetical protein JRO89_XS06G0175000 [Xanthoceras sorbifolium]